MLAAVSIGASHLVLSPQAGALFGYQLLWLVLAAHLFKYPAFEFGPRYAAATGQNLLAGYARVAGPRGWALLLFLLSTVLQGIGVLAGVVSVSGCVLQSWTGLWSIEGFSLLLLAAVLALLRIGGFSWLDHLNKLMVGVLALATLLAFLPALPPPSAATGLLLPRLPEGSIVLVAAILGWMPTGIDVSIWHSFWTLEKLELLGERGAALEDRLRQLKISLFDMRTGYALSLLTGLMFICLGAVHLAGRGAELSGVQFVETISGAYASILGRWMAHVFMLTAFFAMFSTSYTVIDGFSRSFSEGLAALAPQKLAAPEARRRSYGGFALFSAALAALFIAWIGNPVTLVTVVALVSLVAAPVLYGLNLHCIKRDVRDQALQPSPWIVGLGWAGTAVMVLALGLAFYVKVLAA